MITNDKMTAAFIIRFHYEENDPRFEWRFNYFKEEVLPRILAQTNQDFMIAIRCNHAHDKLFKDLSEKIKVFHVFNEEAKYKTGGSGAKYFYDFVPWSQIKDLKKYDIQMGLDSDDLIDPNYYQRIIAQLQCHDLTKSLHISFQPRLLDVKTKQDFPIKQIYSPEKGSAFFALYQPDKENFHFAYEISHLRLGTLASKSITVGEGYCFASCHDLNESTHL